MNLTVFGFGHCGARITDELARFDANTDTDLCVSTTVFETDTRILDQYQHVDATIPYGRYQFNGKGSQVDIEPVVKATRNIEDTIVDTAQQHHKKEFDGFLLIGALGGGTGGGGVAVCADVLQSVFPTKPIYAVGVLPSSDEPDVMTLMASRALQSWVDVTDNVILYDNDELNVGVPALTDTIDEETHTAPEIFAETNHTIARTLHFVFTSTHATNPDDNDSPSSTDSDSANAVVGMTPTRDTLIDVFACSGMSMITYTSQELPTEAWPGIRGSIARFWSTLFPSYTEQPTENSPNSKSLGSNTQEESRSYSDSSVFQSVTEWPHPADLLPELFNEDALTCGTNPQLCTNSYTLLIGQSRLFERHDIEAVTDWMTEAVDAKTVNAGVYPIESRQIAAIHISAGIGIQPRIHNLHADAELIAERILAKQKRTQDAKKQNDFGDYDTSVPPAL